MSRYFHFEFYAAPNATLTEHPDHNGIMTVDEAKSLGYPVLILGKEVPATEAAAMTFIERGLAHLESEPVYGLKVQSRPYRCDYCGERFDVSTNHTGPCFAYCKGCSWKGMPDGNGGYARPSHSRPVSYVGGPVANDERNPHAMETVSNLSADLIEHLLSEPFRSQARTKARDSLVERLRAEMISEHPATRRPGMFAGPRGDRTKEQWEADARAAYDSPGPAVKMP